MNYDKYNTASPCPFCGNNQVAVFSYPIRENDPAACPNCKRAGAVESKSPALVIAWSK